jgi:hypothetical protein
VQCTHGLPWYRYDPFEHALVELPGTEANADEARNAASHAVPTNKAILLGFVAEPGKTAAKYHESESIVWRDAGVLLGYLSLLAEVLQLDFCPLGMTGAPFLDRLHDQGKLFGAGMALVGTQ